nr:Rieske 2Fe-2S domain-containing protein [Modestobacter roseus]
MVRGRESELRAFLNVCRHRGALLCTEESGQTKRTLRCPYHAVVRAGRDAGRRSDPAAYARRRPGGERVGASAAAG